MKLRSSRRLTRSSDLRAKRRAFTDTLAGHESSRVPASGGRPSVLHSVRKRRRDLTHSNLHELKVYELRTGQFSVDSNSHSNTSRLGVSQSAHSNLGPASPRLPSGVHDNDSYRGRPENMAIPLNILRECSICVERKGKRQFPPLECLPKCGHVASVCKSCIVRYSMNALETHGQWHQILCLECKESLGESYVESVVSRQDFQKLRALAARKEIEAHPRFRNCLAANCSSGQIHENTQDDIVVCKSCGSKSCFKHGVPWHEGYTCDRYDDSHPDASVLRTSEERVRTLAKKCPGEGCKFFVEKDGGCDSMWCSLCRNSWNWASVKFGGDETVHSLTDEISQPVSAVWPPLV